MPPPKPVQCSPFFRCAVAFSALLRNSCAVLLSLFSSPGNRSRGGSDSTPTACRTCGSECFFFFFFSWSTHGNALHKSYPAMFVADSVCLSFPSFCAASTGIGCAAQHSPLWRHSTDDTSCPPSIILCRTLSVFLVYATTRRRRRERPRCRRGCPGTCGGEQPHANQPPRQPLFSFPFFSLCNAVYRVHVVCAPS